MHTIMKSCAILHNMMVEHREKLDEGIGRTAEDLTVGPAAPYCFLRSDDPLGEIPPGSIAAVCAVDRFLEYAEEYIETRRLVMEHVCQQMR